MKRSLQTLGLFILMTCVYSFGWAQVDPNLGTIGCSEPDEVSIENVDKYKADMQFKLSPSNYQTITHAGEHATTYTTTSTDYRVAHRYATDDLALYNEYQLTKVSFVPIATTTATYTIMVYRVNSGANPPTTPTYQQAITYTSLTMGVWNEITLTTPVTINSTQELWIAIRCQTRSGTRLSFAGDSGPAVPLKGVKLYSGYSWGNSTVPYNWCIKGTIASPNSYKVEYDLAGYTQGAGKKITLNYALNDTSMALESLSGLMSNTSYDAYIQRNCGSEVSSWVGPYTFTTLKDDDWCTDDFESYNVGNRLAQVSGVNGCWSTNGGGVGNTQDAAVSSEQAYQGSQSAKFIYNNYMIFKLGNKTEGSHIVEYQLYLPTGKDAELALLQTATQMTCSLRLNYTTTYPGRCSLRVAGSTATFTITTNKWVPVRFEVNLHVDSCKLTIDGYERKWKYSTTIAGAAGTKQLYGLHFKPPTNASRSEFYVDNINVPAPGTKDNPLTIDNAQDLLDLQAAVNQNGTYKNIPATAGTLTGFAGKYFIVTNDIDLSSVCGPNLNGGQAVNFVPIGTTARPFKGKINGQQYAIQNLYINATQANMGLFGFIEGGRVDSLHFAGGSVTGGANVGVLCATARGGASFTAITNGLKILGTENVGGIIGSLSQSSTLSQSTNSGSIVATIKNAGGLVGNIDNSTVNLAVNGGYIKGGSTIGGIVGVISGSGSSISNAINTGMVISNDTEVGGIVGKLLNTPTIASCYYDNQIFPNTSAGDGKSTNDMMDSGLQGFLGGSYWVYTGGIYPRLAISENRPVALLAATPILLDPTENIEILKNAIMLNLDNGVTWTSSNVAALTIDNNEATLNCLNAQSTAFLVAHLGQLEKEYEILNNRVNFYLADTIRLCQSQLPYLYQDSILITAPFDTVIPLVSSYGCDSIISMTVIVNSSPQVTIIGNTETCYGDSISLSATRDQSTDQLLWSTGDTTSFLNINGVTNNMTITVQTARNFDRITCYDYDTIQIVCNPVYNHTDTVGICYSFLPYEYGNTGIFFTDSGWQTPIVFQSEKGCDSIINAYVHLYFDTHQYDTVVICEKQLPLTYRDTLFLAGTISGDYTLVATDTTTGCQDYINLHLVVVGNPRVVISGDLSPCYGKNTMLLARSDKQGDHLIWNTGDTTGWLNITNVTSNMTISIIGTRTYDATTCYGYDTVQVIYDPIYNHTDTVNICYTYLPYEYGNTGIIFTDSGWQNPITFQSAKGCDSIVSVYVHLYYDTYQYDTVVICENHLPFTYSDTVFLEGTVSGNYIITSINQTGCHDIVNLILTVNPIPTVISLVGTERLFLGDNGYITVNTSDNFVWSTGETGYQIFITPTTVGIIDYMVYLSNGFGCLDTAVYSVDVSSCGENYPAVDFENNSYQTKFYGSTCWMIENLRSTRFADGQPIVGALSYHSSVYPDSVYNVSVYGRLYSWYTAMRYGNEIQYNSPDLDNQGVCPQGWRLPTHAEYMELITMYNYSLADLKSANYWLDNSGNNSSGFTWLPAGLFNYGANQFMNLYGNGYFITTTSTTDSYFESFSCGYNCPIIQVEITHKNNSYSVRCVKTITNANPY